MVANAPGVTNELGVLAEEPGVTNELRDLRRSRGCQ